MSSTGQEPSEDHDSAWDAIVADLSGSMQMDIGDLGAQMSATPCASTKSEPGQDPDPFIEELLAEGHFEPALPEPIPMPDTIGRFAWAAALGGPLLIVMSAVFGLGSAVTTVALLASIAGFVTLVARKREPETDRPDDGAVV